ncbi:MAG: histidine kinase, partial [Deltaproteobacteria bacterium]|nr:histidine kinase [Deltaproteobacteria bacterium]
ESIGQLAAGIAHEINTPIQFVGDNTRFLKDSFRELQTALESLRNGTATSDSLDAAEIDFLSSEIPRAIEQTLEGVSRVSTIVRAMKEFAHPGSDKKQAVDINRLIESTSIVSTNEWKYAAEMSLVLDRNLPLVPCHAAELNQAVLNLIVNAAHAIAEKSGAKKGKITVSTSLDGDYGVISVADTGAGIPDNVAPKVFDPFFTTKPIGKGTGQGLSMTRSIIVERHGGMIGFRTVPGEGTTFNIHLPLTA